MTGKLNKLQILCFLVWVLIVLPAFLCSCESKADREARERQDREDREARERQDREFWEARERAGAYFQQALNHYQAGRYEESIAAYKKILDIDPNATSITSVYINMGTAYSDLGQHTEAIAAYKKAIAINPDFAEAYINMGVIYERLRQYPEAIAAYKKYLSLAPKGEMADLARKYISELSTTQPADKENIEGAKK